MLLSGSGVSDRWGPTGPDVHAPRSRYQGSRGWRKGLRTVGVASPCQSEGSRGCLWRVVIRVVRATGGSHGPGKRYRFTGILKSGFRSTGDLGRTGRWRETRLRRWVQESGFGF